MTWKRVVAREGRRLTNLCACQWNRVLHVRATELCELFPETTHGEIYGLLRDVVELAHSRRDHPSATCSDCASRGGRPRAISDIASECLSEIFAAAARRQSAQPDQVQFQIGSAWSRPRQRRLPIDHE